jgi:hypothetical protein
VKSRHRKRRFAPVHHRPATAAAVLPSLLRGRDPHRSAERRSRQEVGRTTRVEVRSRRVLAERRQRTSGVVGVLSDEVLRFRGERVGRRTVALRLSQPRSRRCLLGQQICGLHDYGSLRLRLPLQPVLEPNQGCSGNRTSRASIGGGSDRHLDGLDALRDSGSLIDGRPESPRRSPR